MKYIIPVLILFPVIAFAAPKITECPKVKQIDPNIEAVAISFDANQKRTALAYLENLHYYHYKKLSIDDNFSQKLLQKYLENIDGRKSFFLQSDIDEFQRKYANQLDNTLLQKDLSPLLDMYQRFRERAINRLTNTISILKSDYQYALDRDEFIITDRDQFQWSQTLNDNQKLWNKLITLQLVDLKLAGNEVQEAREKIILRLKNQLVNIKRLDSNDVLAGYLNSVGNLYDPHTSYFSPVQQDDFAINISLSLEGIGASLVTRDNVIEVASIVPGSPASKTNQLKEGDKIIGVAEGDNCDFIDVVGMPLREVVQYIRGKKGSLVRLQIVDADAKDNSEKMIVPIIRDKIDLEDSAAKKELRQVNFGSQTLSFGIIDLPSFYIDAEGQSRNEPNYRSTTRDIKNLLLELEETAGKLDGIIIDLRQNGGGSLGEVIALSDLFLAPGPVVQIKHARLRKASGQSAKRKPIFEQPLVVLIDQYSASASEIFAAVIQDYNRGVVVGLQTYGKGTVQAIRGLPVGQAKITESKFYRVSGGSTQIQGVVPDITLPYFVNREKFGEGALDNALPWDTIRSLSYPNYRIDSVLPQLQQRFSARLKTNPELIFLQQRANVTRERSNIDRVSINIKERESNREFWDAQYLKVENNWRQARGYPLKISNAKQTEASNTETAAVENADEVEVKIPDIALEESINILTDLYVVTNPPTQAVK